MNIVLRNYCVAGIVNSKQQSAIHLFENVPDSFENMKQNREGGNANGALDAIQGHDAVLESNFELRFGLLHLLLADVGLAGSTIKGEVLKEKTRGMSHMQAIDGV
jgi:hypothetical protein